MTQLCIEEAIVLRLRSDDGRREQEASEEDALEKRLHEVASRQGRR